MLQQPIAAQSYLPIKLRKLPQAVRMPAQSHRLHQPAVHQFAAPSALETIFISSDKFS
jgi:hypothetical protein